MNKILKFVADTRVYSGGESADAAIAEFNTMDSALKQARDALASIAQTDDSWMQGVPDSTHLVVEGTGKIIGVSVVGIRRANEAFKTLKLLGY